jgi:ubiquinone biosynthesis protein UbiJ
MPRWARWAPGAAQAVTVYAPPLDGEQELCFLKGQVEYLENSLEQLKNRIEELEKKD